MAVKRIVWVCWMGWLKLQAVLISFLLPQFSSRPLAVCKVILPSFWIFSIIFTNHSRNPCTFLDFLVKDIGSQKRLNCLHPVFFISKLQCNGVYSIWSSMWLLHIKTAYHSFFRFWQNVGCSATKDEAQTTSKAKELTVCHCYVQLRQPRAWRVEF